MNYTLKGGEKSLEKVIHVGKIIVEYENRLIKQAVKLAQVDSIPTYSRICRELYDYN